MRSIIHRPRRTATLATLACLLGGLASGPALAAEDPAALSNCYHTNLQGDPWAPAKPLSSSSAIGDVLQKRIISHFFFYKAEGRSAPHELVLGGAWRGVGYPQAFDTVRTNIDGIGFRVVYDGENHHSDDRNIPSNGSPLVLGKIKTSTESPSTVIIYRQELVLLTDPANLPSGVLRITDISGGAGLELTTGDTVKGALSVGGRFEKPSSNPSDVCWKTYQLSSAQMLDMGGGLPPPIVNKCEVATKVVPVSLGRFSLKEVLSSPSWTSTPQDFKLRFSECTAQAKPQIWFQDKNTPNNAGETLSLDGSGATGIGIAMYTTAGSPRRVRYAANAPGNDAQYKLEHLDNDRAQLTLRAQYVRNGDPVVKAGQANGTAMFTVTYP